MDKLIKKIKRLSFYIKFNYLLRGTKVVVIGDSHAEVFYFIKDKKILGNMHIDIVSVGGATAQGITNPNSKTNSLNVFLKRIKRLRHNQFVLLLLGEVDCGFVIWYYSEKYNVSIDKQLERSIKNYTSFINNLKKRNKNIIVISAPLPTIEDGQDWGEIADARKSIKATQVERTNLTIKFNDLMKTWCQKNDVGFIDTTPYLLDTNTNIIKKKYMNKNKLDHHLDNEEYSKILIKEIRKVIY